MEKLLFQIFALQKGYDGEFCNADGPKVLGLWITVICYMFWKRNLNVLIRENSKFIHYVLSIYLNRCFILPGHSESQPF